LSRQPLICLRNPANLHAPDRAAPRCSACSWADARAASSAPADRSARWCTRKHLPSRSRLATAKQQSPVGRRSVLHGRSPALRDFPRSTIRPRRRADLVPHLSEGSCPGEATEAAGLVFATSGRWLAAAATNSEVTRSAAPCAPSAQGRRASVAARRTLADGTGCGSGATVPPGGHRERSLRTRVSHWALGRAAIR